MNEMPFLPKLSSEPVPHQLSQTKTKFA